MTKRVFAFGCSVTSYRWPTWADIIGKSYKNKGYEYYNFANSGSGNEYILNSLYLTDTKFKLTPDDIIIIMWSSWNREDRYIVNYNWTPEIRGQWTKEGNILTAVMDSPRYDPSFLKYWSLEHDISKNITAIKSARKCFNITYDDYIPPYEQSENASKNNNANIGDRIFEAYTSKWDTSKDSNWYKVFSKVRPNPDPRLDIFIRLDGHPLPSEALAYVQQFTDFDIDDDTVEWVNEWSYRMIQWSEINNKRETPIVNSWGDFHDTEFVGMIDETHAEEQQVYAAGTYVDLWTDDCFIDLLNDFDF